MLVCRQQWWPKRLQLLSTAAQTSQTNSQYSKRQLCSLLFILIDHNMVFTYNYGKQKKGGININAPPLQAISMAMRVRWSNTDGIAQCGMPRATPEANGRCHQATTCSVLPQQPPGHQQTKRQQKKMDQLCWPF
jgi:hypothetical protein